MRNIRMAEPKKLTSYKSSDALMKHRCYRYFVPDYPITLCKYLHFISLPRVLPLSQESFTQSCHSLDSVILERVSFTTMFIGFITPPPLVMSQVRNVPTPNDGIILPLA